MPACKNCKNSFDITKQDKEFYQKIEVSEPTWCPDCRMQRRLAWRNPKTFYSRKCDLCHKEMISVYSSNNKFPVYCNECYWSDKWDPRDYGREYDFNRSFFEQYFELFSKTPKSILLAQKNQNADYTSHSENCKNCYFCSVIFDSEECYYSHWIFDCRNIVNSYELYDDCELCFNSVLCFRCYNCIFTYICKDSNDLKFCSNCIGCHDCFMSYNLRNASYVFKGKQLTKEEYNKRINKINFGSYKIINKLQKEFGDLGEKTIHKFAETINAENSTGDYLFNTKNCHNCFIIFDGENLKNCWGAGPAKDCMDCSGFGKPIGSELLYEVQGVGHGYNSHFLHMVYHVKESQYITNSYNVNNCFACSSLKGHNFCIFNKQYSEIEYQKLKNKIINQMKKTGEYGEFFPVQYSPFGYNETIANDLIPLSQEEAIRKGFNWQENTPDTIGQKTLFAIPDDIKNIKESILNEILACEKCGKNYKIISQEFDFYKKNNLPLPRLCPNCRYIDLISIFNPCKLYDRQCAKCNKEVKTTYSPKRPEIIYCEDCFNKEIY